MNQEEKLRLIRRPKSGTWSEKGWVEVANGLMFENAMGVRAISAVQMVDGKPQWQVSFSHMGARIPSGWMEALLKQWDIEEFDEDNHVPNGKVRNYWKPFDSLTPTVCPCKDKEPPTEEEGGYVWRPDSQESSAWKRENEATGL